MLSVKKKIGFSRAIYNWKMFIRLNKYRVDCRILVKERTPTGCSTSPHIKFPLFPILIVLFIVIYFGEYYFLLYKLIFVPVHVSWAIKIYSGGFASWHRYKAPSQINALQSKITFAICPYLPLRLIFFILSYFSIFSWTDCWFVGQLPNYTYLWQYFISVFQ